jgi:hypothetical protein
MRYVPQRISALTALVLLVAICPRAHAQQKTSGGTITGTVRDSAARPGDHRTRTDSAGRFRFTGLDADKYTVRARKLGLAPEEWDATVSNGGSVDIKLVLSHAMPMLDTVTVRADRQCSTMSLDGFVCRRRSGRGEFLDYTDIDDKGALYTADLFREMKGFRVDVRPTRSGPIRVVAPQLPWGCSTPLVDGRPLTGANPIPEFPYDLIALEVYAKPDSVPKEYQRYTWPQHGDFTRSGRCSVVVYWTKFARMNP